MTWQQHVGGDGATVERRTTIRLVWLVRSGMHLMEFVCMMCTWTYDRCGAFYAPAIGWLLWRDRDVLSRRPPALEGTASDR